MDFPVTADQVRQTVIDHGITHLPHHDCGGCGTWVKYVFSETNGEVAPFFNSNCSCSSHWSSLDPRSWQELADWFNMQTAPSAAQSIWDRMMEQATKQPTERAAEAKQASAERITDEQIAEWLAYEGDLARHAAVGPFNMRSLLTELQHRREAEARTREPTPEMINAGIKAHRDDFADERDLMASVYRAMLAASPSSPASRVRVKVKPLDWGKTSYGTPEAFSVAGVYRINHAMNGGWSVVFGGLSGRALSGPDGRDNFATIGDAKAAAQAHFDAAALGEQP